MTETGNPKLIQLVKIQREGNGTKKSLGRFYRVEGAYNFNAFIKNKNPQLDVFCYDSSLLDDSQGIESNARKKTYSTFSEQQGWEKRYNEALKEKEKFNQFWNWKPNTKNLSGKIAIGGVFVALSSFFGASPLILIPTYFGVEGLQSKIDQLENRFSLDNLGDRMKDRMKDLETFKDNLNRAKVNIYQPGEAKEYIERLGKFVNENPFARLERNGNINNRLMEIYRDST